MEVAILVISFIVLIGLRVPVAWSIGIAALLTLLMSTDTITAVTTVSQRVVTGLDSFSLLAISFFILAGHIMNRGVIDNRLIEFAKALVVSIPCSLATFYIV